MSIAGQERSWSVTYEAPRPLHHALYVREALRIHVRASEHLPPSLVDDVPTRGEQLDDEISSAAIAAEWTRWWHDTIRHEAELRALLARSRRIGSRTSEERRAIRDCIRRAETPRDDALAKLVQDIGAEFNQWFDHAKAAAAKLPLSEGIAEASKAIERTHGRSAIAGRISVGVLLVSRGWRQQVQPGVVLISTPAIYDSKVLSDALQEACLSLISNRSA